MALLNSLVGSTLEQLRSQICTPSETSEMEARVGGLCALLQQAATRLCPAASAAATDAALSLLSGLQAARLRLQPDAPRTAAASLECCIQQLLRVLHQGLEPLTPAPAPVAAPPPRPAADCFRAAGDTAQHTTQLAALVKGLGFDAADWKVAQAGLAQRTAQALQSQRLSTTELAAVAAAAATEQASPQELEAILLAAAAIPAWQEGSSQPSALHDAVAEVLWVMRQFRPPAELPPDQRPHLSAEGWAAYWLLEPRAFQQTIAEILQAAVAQQQQQQQHEVARQELGSQVADADGSGSGGQLAQLQQLLQQHSHWHATPAAVARHPALHLVARQALHEWLAASGNPAAWRLLLLYMHAARNAWQAELQQGQLPAEIRVLYPAALAGVAALLHMQPPSEAGLAAAVADLDTFLQLQQPAGGAAGEAQPLSAVASAAATAQRQQQAWQLQLDAPGWLLFALKQLPVHYLLNLAAAASGSMATGADGGSDAAGSPTGSQPQATASPAAAAYAAMALWPGEPRRQQVLREALLLQLEDIDLPAVRLWLEQLHSWQGMLREASAWEHSEAAPAAAAAIAQVPGP